jgi:hypothetical protein
MISQDGRFARSAFRLIDQVDDIQKIPTSKPSQDCGRDLSRWCGWAELNRALELTGELFGSSGALLGVA